MAKDLSPEEVAYQIALERIEEARVTGATKLDLNGYTTDALRVLTHLPPEISTLRGLTDLRLNHTQVNEISALNDLTGLMILRLDGTQISDISALSVMTELKTLMLDRTQITDISALSGMTRMQTLTLYGTHVTDISALSGMTGMQTLRLDGTQVTDLSPLCVMGHLTGKGPGNGLWITNTPATRADPTLAEYAAIEKNAERTQKIMAYLREKHGQTAPAGAPVPTTTPPSQSSLAQAAILLTTPNASAQDAQRLYDQIAVEAETYVNETGVNRPPEALTQVQSALLRIVTGADRRDQEATARAIEELETALANLADLYVEIQDQLRDAETRAALADELRLLAERQERRMDYLADRAEWKRLQAEEDAAKRAARADLKARITDECFLYTRVAVVTSIVSVGAYLTGGSVAALAGAIEPLVSLVRKK